MNDVKKLFAAEDREVVGFGPLAASSSGGKDIVIQRLTRAKVAFGKALYEEYPIESEASLSEYLISHLENGVIKNRVPRSYLANPTAAPA